MSSRIARLEQTFCEPRVGGGPPPARHHAQGAARGRTRLLSSASCAMRPWTSGEDTLLCDALAAHGAKWELVASCVPARSSAMCRNRFQRMQRFASAHDLPRVVAALRTATPRRRTGGRFGGRHRRRRLPFPSVMPHQQHDACYEVVRLRCGRHRAVCVDGVGIMATVDSTGDDGRPMPAQVTPLSTEVPSLCVSPEHVTDWSVKKGNLQSPPPSPRSPPQHYLFFADIVYQAQRGGSPAPTLDTHMPVTLWT